MKETFLSPITPIVCGVIPQVNSNILYMIYPPPDFYKFLGDSWGILFSHPADYTPVCTTELGRTAALKSEFDKRNVKVLALSVDPVDKHLGWISDINETQKCNVEFPIIADDDKKVSNLYDFIHPNASTTATVRSLVIIAPDKRPCPRSPETKGCLFSLFRRRLL